MPSALRRSLAPQHPPLPAVCRRAALWWCAARPPRLLRRRPPLRAAYLLSALRVCLPGLCGEAEAPRMPHAVRCQDGGPPIRVEASRGPPGQELGLAPAAAAAATREPVCAPHPCRPPRRQWTCGATPRRPTSCLWTAVPMPPPRPASLLRRCGRRGSRCLCRCNRVASPRCLCTSLLSLCWLRCGQGGGRDRVHGLPARWRASGSTPAWPPCPRRPAGVERTVCGGQGGHSGQL